MSFEENHKKWKSIIEQVWLKCSSDVISFVLRSNFMDGKFIKVKD